MSDVVWRAVCDDLSLRLGKNNYLTWIEPLRLVAIEGGVARLAVPTTFFGDWVARHFADAIRAALGACGAGAERLEFIVARQGMPAGAQPSDRPAEAARETGRDAGREGDRESGAEADLPGAPLEA
ncbi:MAG: DnaA N-terminal domain-containing protein, partial [Gemmobacter sp.]